MANKTFYIPDDDAALWDAARRVAKRRRTSLYRVVADALVEDLPRQDAETPPEPTDRWAHIAADAA